VDRLDVRGSILQGVGGSTTAAAIAGAGAGAGAGGNEEILNNYLVLEGEFQHSLKAVLLL
jgi:hypothetical protein